MGRRKTQEEWEEEVTSLAGTEYTFLEPYKNGATKLKVVHNKCKHIYHVKPNVFLNGRRCPECANKLRVAPTAIKLTDEEWKDKVFKLVQDEYTFTEPYKDSKTMVEVIHNTCGNTYKVKPQNFTRGSRCPKCRHQEGTRKHTKTQEDFDNEVRELYGDEYGFLEPYVNTYTAIKVRHNQCGQEYKVAPRDFIKGSQCRQCRFKAQRKTQE